MDWTQYWFMFPVSICVATTAMLSGIGGSALFIPIFVIIFPILGPDYPLSTAAVIGTALVTVVFGFSSGFIGYHRKKLIDFRSAIPFIGIAVSVAIAGALTLASLKDHDTLLKATYAVLMFGLCLVILKRTPSRSASDEGRGDFRKISSGDIRTIVSWSGERYMYPTPRVGFIGGVVTGIGAFMTGLLGVGIGEVIMSQLVKRNRVPLAIAAATSIFAVIVTIAAASSTQVTALIAAGGVTAIPWNIVCYTIPGVIIGGQIGPGLQGRIAQRTMEKAIAALFGFIGVAMMWIVIT